MSAKAKSLLGVAVAFFFLWFCFGAGSMVQHQEFMSFSWPAFSIASGGAMLGIGLVALLFIIITSGLIRQNNKHMAAKREKSDVVNFRCPTCGHLTRLLFLPGETTITFTCDCCDRTLAATK